MRQDFSDQQTIAENIHAEAIASLSVTRDDDVEITSARQLSAIEDAGRRILAMRLADERLNAAATSLLERASAARRWTWVDVPAATALTALAVAVALSTAVLGGTGGNIVLAALGGLLGSALLAVVVLRYRRENWRIRAERIAPMIWRPGI